eukprot:146632-Rhodomonas_salina.1
MRRKRGGERREEKRGEEREREGDGAGEGEGERGGKDRERERQREREREWYLIVLGDALLLRDHACLSRDRA